MKRAVERLRVVQWSTGNVGLRSLRALIEHPAMDLVGVYVHSSQKVGRDAGDICGTEPVGVQATNDVSAILALRADCILYMPPDCDFHEVAAILRSGTNIVTTKGEFQNPDCMNSDERKMIEDACREGGSSIHSAGSSPGFATDGLPILLASLQRRLDCLTVDEFADSSSRDSPDMLFNVLGYGRAPSAAEADRLAQHMLKSRRRSFHLLADAFGVSIDAVEASAEIGIALHRTEIVAGVIEAGTMAGMRITISGMHNGKPLLRFRANWYVTPDMDVDWDLMHSGWRIRVDGDTPLDVKITFPVTLEEYPIMSPGLTAHPAVNAVHAVCAAQPGICTSLDLPQITPLFG
jgi:4-hydroxy-tetrahydrodipicolinate reductase